MQTIPFIGELTFFPPQNFWLVCFLVLLAVPVIWEWRKRNRALKSQSIRIHGSTSRIPSRRQRIWWWSWFLVATLLLVAAYANPQKITTIWDPVYERIRITFIFDVSLSMKRAEDIQPNRLEAAKDVLWRLVEALGHDNMLKGKYQLALIPFSAEALPYYLPFTSSRDEFFHHLDMLDEETIKKRGTSIWAALKAYDELLLSRPPPDPNTLDLGILISDGGKEEIGPERDLYPRVMANLRDRYRVRRFIPSGEIVIARAKDPQRNVVLYTVGVGRVEVDNTGRAIVQPAPLIIRDKAGNFMGYQYVGDDLRNPVETSAFYERVLRDLAEMGGGEYRHFADRHTILGEFKKIVLAHRQERERIPHSRLDSIRWIFLVPAFIMYYFLFGYGKWISLVFLKVFLYRRST